MKTIEFIEKYGIEAYGRKLERWRAWRADNPKKTKARDASHNAELYHKSGKYYEQQTKYKKTGIPGEKAVIRGMHGRIYRIFKRIIDPFGLTQIHHEYLNDGTANFRGVALVEKEEHQHGIIDVIHILDGKITLFTEKEIKDQRYDINGEVILERSEGERNLL